MAWRNRLILVPLYFIADLTCIICSFYLSWFLRFGEITDYIFSFHPVLRWSVVSWVALALLFDLYKIPRRHAGTWRPARFSLAQFLFIGSVAFYTVLANLDLIPRLFLLYFISIQFLLLLFIRYVRSFFVRFIRTRGYNQRQVILMGSQDEYNKITEWSRNNPWSGLKAFYIDGTIASDEKFRESISPYLNQTTGKDFIIGTINHNVDLVKKYVYTLEDMGARIFVLDRFSEMFGEAAGKNSIGPFSVNPYRPEPLQKTGSRIFKRSFDILGSLAGICFLFIIMPFAGLLIKLSSPGRVIFKQLRIGKYRKPFGCYKFRTMRKDTKCELGLGEKTCNNDSRITTIGKFLRKTNIDEFPQFFNVLIGDMSIVGPRPHMIAEDRALEEVINRYRIRQFVKPGITGLAAVNGYRGGTDDMDLMQKRTDIDIEYIRTWSPWLDIKICCKTIAQMCSSSNNGE